MLSHKFKDVFFPLLFWLYGIGLGFENWTGSVGDDKFFLHIDFIASKAIHFSDGILRHIVDNRDSIQGLVWIYFMNDVIIQPLSPGRS
jgi:hypothetical protein